MGGMNDGMNDESVDIRYAEPDALAAEVARLEAPWIGDEGPLDADFRHHDGGGGGGELTLHLRGLAFDARTTVLWDEDLVQVICPKAAEDGVLARSGDVLIREKICGRRTGLASVVRIDYLRQGVLIASRYLPGRPRGGESDA